MGNFKESHIASRSRRQELRQRATQAEERLWPALRALRKTGFIFRRQHSIDWYVADFYCPKARLVIEIDGSIHDQEPQKANDVVRDQWMTARGIRILRFCNEEIEEDFPSVTLKIGQALGL